MNRESSPPQGRRQFLLLAALFFTPVLAAIVLYFWAPQSWRPAGHVQNGVLVNPARPLERSLPDDVLKGHWTLLYIGSSSCADACRERLYFTRQVRTALGKDSRRIRRAYVAADREQIKGLQEFLGAEHQDAQLVVAEGQNRLDLLNFFSLDGTLSPLEAGNVYLLDPHGNWLMYYRAEDEPKGMLKDLKKLLRISKIG